MFLALVPNYVYADPFDCVSDVVCDPYHKAVPILKAELEELRVAAYRQVARFVTKRFGDTLDKAIRDYKTRLEQEAKNPTLSLDGGIREGKGERSRYWISDEVLVFLSTLWDLEKKIVVAGTLSDEPVVERLCTLLRTLTSAYILLAPRWYRLTNDEFGPQFERMEEDGSMYLDKEDYEAEEKDVEPKDSEDKTETQ